MARKHRDSARGTDLSRALSALRERANISQARAAEACGVAQNAISRFETARAVPSPEVLPPLLDALSASTAERRDITELARKERPKIAEDVPARVVLERGVASFQQRIYDIEEQALLVRSFHASTILGVLQTEPYIVEVFRGFGSEAEQARAVQKRLQRRRLLLDESDRQWVLLQTEGALRWNFAGNDAMAAQMDSIAEMIDSCPRVRVGIIPSMRQVDAQPLHGFHVYDFAEDGYRRPARMAQVGTHTGTALLKGGDTKVYVDLFKKLEECAVYGDEAMELLGRIAGEYREMP